MSETTKLHYVDNGDDTVTDTKHAIMWMKKRYVVGVRTAHNLA